MFVNTPASCRPALDHGRDLHRKAKRLSRSATLLDRHAGRRQALHFSIGVYNDFVVFCETQEDALLVKDSILPKWLADRGLTLSEEKTRVVHLTEGFDFLGFTIRHHPAPRTTRTGHKLLIRPSRKSVNGLRDKLRDVWHGLNGQAIQAVLWQLNPVLRGWANYFRTGVASETFRKLDNWMYRRAVRHVRRAHPRKSGNWLMRRYWGKLNPKREDHWVFGDKHTGHFLLKFRWFKIERHILVKGTASPDDPNLQEYWWSRQRVNIRYLSVDDVELANRQDWACPVCGMMLINGDPLERHHWHPQSEGGTNVRANRVLVHLYCHQQLTAAWREGRRRATPS